VASAWMFPEKPVWNLEIFRSGSTGYPRISFIPSHPFPHISGAVREGFNNSLRPRISPVLGQSSDSQILCLRHLNPLVGKQLNWHFDCHCVESEAMHSGFRVEFRPVPRSPCHYQKPCQVHGYVFSSLLQSAKSLSDRQYAVDLLASVSLRALLMRLKCLIRVK